jgi:hypothetical protein
MKPSCWYRTRALLLALLLGAGVGLSFGQASAMSARIAIEMADLGSDGCHGCDGAENDGADAMSCLLVCASAAQGVLPGEPADLSWASRAAFRIAHVLGNGHVSSTDHGPPKLLTLG